MAPQRENRILAPVVPAETDRPATLVHCTMGDLDAHSVAVLRDRAERALLAGGTDDRALGAWIDASHHMGTTRMGRSTADSVVDPDLALHGVEGVHVVGTSVAPTSGSVSPTLTAVALGSRLACRLAVAGS